jgi:hypothetical protein
MRFGSTPSDVRLRPLWQRILFALAGSILILLGVVMLFTPGPGIAVLLIGVPLFVCVHPKLERRARAWADRMRQKLRARFGKRNAER